MTPGPGVVAASNHFIKTSPQTIEVFGILTTARQLSLWLRHYQWRTQFHNKQTDPQKALNSSGIRITQKFPLDLAVALTRGQWA